ncbi:uncharacterized protein [Asterias amurensis]|uniref:uncharacterized protein isoform X2 n=1 Tax=Asterias amurensis TaxID=7602 RepID=UPI003AB73E6A
MSGKQSKLEIEKAIKGIRDDLDELETIKERITTRLDSLQALYTENMEGSFTRVNMSIGKPIRFYPELDIVLLKEVVAVNPCHLQGAKTHRKWETILSNVNSTLHNKKVSLRACKDRMKTLLKAHRQAEMMSLKASGTDEEYKERDQLLTEVDELCAEASRETEEERQRKADDENKQGCKIREAATKGMRPQKRQGDNIELKQPKKSRASFSELLEVLKERNTKESELKTEQLRLERENFKLDKRGRRQRMEHEAATLELIQETDGETGWSILVINPQYELCHLWTSLWVWLVKDFLSFQNIRLNVLSTIQIQIGVG